MMQGENDGLSLKSLRSCRLQESVNHFLQEGLGDCANLLMHNVSVSDKKHSWNPLHTIFHRPLRVFIGVYFCYDELTSIVLRNRLQHWSYHLTRTTPWRPEVYDYRE